MPTMQKVSTETILETLAAHPRLTAADLVEVLGIGRSTAAKHLATDHAAPDDPVGPPTGSPMVSWAPSCTTTWPNDPVRPSTSSRQGTRHAGAVSTLGTMAARGEVELVGDKPLPDRRLGQARPGSSQLPAPGTPRGTDYPTSGVPTTPLVG